MVYCSKCGKKIDDDSLFCTKCGTELVPQKGKSSIDQNIEDFAEEIEQLGKKVGKKIEKSMKDAGSGSEDVIRKSASKLKKAANQVEKDLDDFGKRFEYKDKEFHNWYDDRFGLVSPIVSSFIGLIVLFLIILIFRYLGTGIQMLANLSDFFSQYLFFIFLFMLFSSYITYFSRHYQSWFKWISPIGNSISFVIGFWFFIRVVEIINNSVNSGLISWFLSISDIFIIVVAFLIVFISYVVLFVTMMTPQIISDLKPSKKPTTSIKQKKSKETDIKRLYRSGRNKIIAGICGGFSEYLQIDVTIIRVILVIVFLITFGFIIIAYLILWIIIPRNPKHEWN